MEQIQSMDHATAPCKYIAPSPTSLFLLYASINRLHVHIAPPPLLFFV